MYRRVVFALMLVMHYSLAFGAIESAAMPDEHHPFGKAVPHDHLHPHLHDNHHHAGDDHSHDVDHQNEHATDLHEHQHKHGINIQLNVDIGGLFALDFYKPDTPSSTPYQLAHTSLSYVPAVPPPNGL